MSSYCYKDGCRYLPVVILFHVTFKPSLGKNLPGPCPQCWDKISEPSVHHEDEEME